MPDQRGQRFDGPAAGHVVALDLHIDPATTLDQIEHFFQRWNADVGKSRAKVAAGIEPPQFRSRKSFYVAMAIGRGIHLEIVDHHQTAILAAMHIQFDPIHAHL